MAVDTPNPAQLEEPLRGEPFTQVRTSRRIGARVRRALWQLRQTAGILLLYSLLTSAMLSPLASDILPKSSADDLANHVSGIIEAKNALAERQFPIRVAPAQNGAARYPIFQFYGNLPYTAGGLLYLTTGLNPYQAWKLIVALSMIFGGFFLYRSAYALTHQFLPSVLAGAVFLSAPYMLTDIHARFAYPEVVSFGLLPVVFFYALRSFVSPKPTNMLLSALAWSGVALSHNITFLYGSIFFCLFFVSYLSWSTKYVRRMLRVGIGYALGVALVAWYFIPQLSILSSLVISDLTVKNGISAYRTAYLAPLSILLSPALVLPVPFPDPMLDNVRFGLQVGWPILIAVGSMLYYLTHIHILRKHVIIIRLLAFFGIAFFMVWSPFDFWRFLPNILNYIQYTYRILMFVVLWGAILSSYALSFILHKRMRIEHFLLCLLLLGAYSSQYLATQASTDNVFLEKEIKKPDMGRGGANGVYMISPALLARASIYNYNINLTSWEYNLITAGDRVILPAEGEIPTPQSGDMLIIQGRVPDVYQKPLTLTVTVSEKVVISQALPPGPFKLEALLQGPYSGDRVPIKMQTDQALSSDEKTPGPPADGKLALFVDRIFMQPTDPNIKIIPFINAGKTKKSLHYGNPTTYKTVITETQQIELPILFYPNLLQVQDNGHDIAYTNIGAFMVIQLPAGSHKVDVYFVGSTWANRVSLVSWIGLGICLVLAVVQQLYQYSYSFKR